ncbi:MAG: hypothetical protein COA41_11215 [Sphingopyxis sp.]|nr:MAG: hypothetical protein COA41_11215 [Sphingopyxis sp.]
MKITKEAALAFIRFRLALIAQAGNRQRLSRLVEIGREDLELIVKLRLIDYEEQIQLQCEMSEAVQHRLTELSKPVPRLRIVG